MRRIGAIAFTAVLASCLAGELELGETEDEVTTTNKLAANKLAANKLSASKVGVMSLSSTTLAASPLAGTADGREVLSYIVSCALPANDSIVLTNGGKTYSFAGAIGLAPGWKLRVPTVSERRWVTACVLARTNAFGVSVPVSLRGAHPRLSSTLGEGLGYLLVEGAFYGDLFDPAGAKLYACSSEIRDLDLDLSTQALRACAISNNGSTTGCGFTYTGKCAVLDLSLQPACTGLLPPYGKCRTVGATRFDEVITAYLATGL
jgi:hypothetical protein